MYNSASPFVFPLISLVCGIYLQSLVHCPIIVCALLFFVLLPALFYVRNRNKNKIPHVIINLMFFITGALMLSLQHYKTKLMLDRLSHKNLELIVTITDKIVRDGYPTGEILELSVEQYRELSESPITAFKKTSCTLLCYTHYKTSMQVGDIVEFENIEIKNKKTETLAGNPTYDDYLIKEDILATIFMHDKIQYTLKERPKYSINRWLWQKRQNIYGQLKNKLSKKTFMYFSLIFLGNKQHATIDNVRKMFNYWGLSHYLARSGLHIVLFIVIWQWILSLIPINFFLKRFLLILICVIYNFLSWYSIPFARAYFAFLLIETGRLCSRQTYYLHILSLICTLILLFNPMQLFFLDFQLTFALTFSLVWISYIIQTAKKSC